MDESVKLRSDLNILNIAFYRFGELNGLSEKRKALRNLCSQLALKGTILLSREGINGMLAGTQDAIRRFQTAFEQESHWSGIWNGMQYKESYSEHIPFQRLLIKLKKEIIPVGDPDIQPAVFTSARLSPVDLKNWLDEKRDFNLLDTRNDYEIEFGTFEKAKTLGLRHFRNIRERIKQVPELDKQKPLVMFCTGGIRCEKASVLAVKEGFQEVYQLDGGILKYFEDCGGAHYQGSCYVFDERIALGPQLTPNPQKPKANET
jgi:UPF0176 protein